MTTEVTPEVTDEVTTTQVTTNEVTPEATDEVTTTQVTTTEVTTTEVTPEVTDEVTTTQVTTNEVTPEVTDEVTDEVTTTQVTTIEVTTESTGYTTASTSMGTTTPWDAEIETVETVRLHVEVNDPENSLPTIKECTGTRINGFILTPKHCCMEKHQVYAHIDRHIQIVDGWPLALRNGDFGFTPNNIIYQFAPPVEPGHGYQPDYDGLCLLRDSKNETLSVDTLWDSRYTQGGMADDFSSCSILALNVKTLQDFEIAIDIKFCDWRGFGIQEKTTIEYCFKLKEVITRDVHIKNGSPIFCNDLGFIGRV